MNHKRTAFTIVELMLAMSVLSILLIAIAFLVIQIGHIYTKGMTLKGLNQVASTISRDVQTTVSQADTSAFSSVKLPSTNGSGRVCTGVITYAWNTPLDNATPNRNLYSGADAATAIHFVRVDDREGNLCKQQPPAGSYLSIDKSKSREMLPAGQYDFAMHEFHIGTSPNDATLHWIIMKIGSTNTLDIDLATQQCTLSSGLSDYCAINTFETTVRSTRKG